MNRDEMIKAAKDTVSRMDADIKDIKLAHAERFFGGTVIVLDYLVREQKRRDYVYYDDDGAVIHSQNFEAFLKSFAEKSDQSLTTMLYLFGGVLALIVVGTVCYLAITTGKVPDVLSAAVTTILGFFFGTVASSKKGK
jgi:hypothetical protein